MSTPSSTGTSNSTGKKSHVLSTAEQKVRTEIDDMLQINGNTSTAHDWVPRVVMMAYERRCANNPNDGLLRECFSVAQSLASRS
jgi:hypothetical protein